MDPNRATNYNVNTAANDTPILRKRRYPKVNDALNY